MLKQELMQLARQLGFARMFVCPLPSLSAWRERVDAVPDMHYERLTDDIAALFPGECRALLLVRPYQPYAAPEGIATVSAYYPVSEVAHQAAMDIEKWLTDKGYRAVGSPAIPYKPLAAQAGVVRYGRNGVTGMDDFGTRIALQVVLTDAPLETDSEGGAEYRLSDSCAGCGRCVQACPTGALDGTGTLDVRRCLRARSDEYPLDEAIRPLVGRSLYGCDICQAVCPRNAGIGLQPMPAELADVLQVERLLAGDVSGLIPYIGKNFARKARIQAKACIIAANTGRKDLLEAIERCKESPVDFVQNHAEWAIRKLSE